MGIPEEPGEYTFQVVGDVVISIFGQPITLGTLVFDALIVVEENENEIFGCTYPTAINYTAYANDDDGTCLFAGCTDEEALNLLAIWQPLATKAAFTKSIPNPDVLPIPTKTASSASPTCSFFWVNSARRVHKSLHPRYA